jgi:hypothetical protein
MREAHAQQTAALAVLEARIADKRDEFALGPPLASDVEFLARQIASGLPVRSMSRREERAVYAQPGRMGRAEEKRDRDAALNVETPQGGAASAVGPKPVKAHRRLGHYRGTSGAAALRRRTRATPRARAPR